VNVNSSKETVNAVENVLKNAKMQPEKEPAFQSAEHSKEISLVVILQKHARHSALRKQRKENAPGNVRSSKETVTVVEKQQPNHQPKYPLQENGHHQQPQLPHVHKTVLNLPPKVNVCQNVNNITVQNVVQNAQQSVWKLPLLVTAPRIASSSKEMPTAVHHSVQQNVPAGGVELVLPQEWMNVAKYQVVVQNCLMNYTERFPFKKKEKEKLTNNVFPLLAVEDMLARTIFLFYVSALVKS